MATSNLHSMNIFFFYLLDVTIVYDYRCSKASKKGNDGPYTKCGFKEGLWCWPSLRTATWVYPSQWGQVSYGKLWNNFRLMCLTTFRFGYFSPFIYTIIAIHLVINDGMRFYTMENLNCHYCTTFFVKLWIFWVAIKGVKKSWKKVEYVILFKYMVFLVCHRFLSWIQIRTFMDLIRINSCNELA